MNIALSLLVLTAFMLVAGATYLWRARGLKKQALLMALLALVMAINVAIWTVPTHNGRTLVGATPDQ